MARKKENKRNDGYYECKCVVGHDIDGKAIYKSFTVKKQGRCQAKGRGIQKGFRKKKR